MQIAIYAAITATVTLTLGLAVSVSLVYVAAARCSASSSSGRPCASPRDVSPGAAIRFFGFSNVYLLLVFAAVAADALITRH